MSLEQLIEKIKTANVPEYLYSINDGLKPNAYILFKNYSKWEFFFLDEKGERNNFNYFTSDSDAYDYLWGKIEIEMKDTPSIPPKSVFGKG